MRDAIRQRLINPSAPMDDAVVKRIVRALMQKAHEYMLITEFVDLVDETLFPAARCLRPEYRQRFDIGVLIHMLEVANASWTVLERGWRRLQIAALAFEDGKEVCGQDPQRHLDAAARLARQCSDDVCGPELVAAVSKLAEAYGVTANVGNIELDKK